MAAASIILTLVSLFTFWLVVPMFVLPPAALWLGLKAHRQRCTSSSPPRGFAKAMSLLPIWASIAAFCFELYAMNAFYRP